MTTSKTVLICKGDVLNYTITKDDFIPISGSQVVIEPVEIDKHLEPVPVMYTLTINPTPSDALVVLSAPGYEQVGNSITVVEGTTVSWNVSKSGYVPQSGSKVVNADEVIAVELPQGQEIDVSDYEYLLDEDVVTLTKFIGSGTSIVIPNVG